MNLSYICFELFINLWIIFSSNLEHLHEATIISLIFSEWKALPKTAIFFFQVVKHTLFPEFLDATDTSLEQSMLLLRGRYLKPPKFEHIFVAVIPFSSFLLFKYF